MRIRLTGSKTVVKLQHFRYCAKHVAILMQLQIEVPNMLIFMESPSWDPMMIPVHKLNLDHEELRFLNPAS